MARSALRVAEALRRAGFEAVFAGGCVRDCLLGIAPHDFDIATSATPGEIIELFPRTIPVGVQFGVVLVVEQGEQVQVATFRTDGVYEDGRHPETVVFSSAEEDAKRRDFTINGLFFDPQSGTILDYVGGREDLARGVLRAIGDPLLRFREDRLRLLRAVRFSARFGFSMDPATWEALVALAPDLQGVSPERIREELVRMFADPKRLEAFDLLDQSGLLSVVFPEMLPLKGCEQPPEFHPEGDVFVHTRLMLSLLPPSASACLAFAVLFHDLGKPATLFVDETGRRRFNGHEKVSADMTLEILQRLRFSNQEIDSIVEMVRNHMAFKDVQKMRPAKLRRLLAKPTFAEELELHRVDCLGSHGLLDNYDFLLSKQQEFAHEPLIPPPLVTGHDLIQLGWKPGPNFRTALDAVQTAQLEGLVATKEQALDWLASSFCQNSNDT